MTTALAMDVRPPGPQGWVIKSKMCEQEEMAWRGEDKEFSFLAVVSLVCYLSLELCVSTEGREGKSAGISV